MGNNISCNEFYCQSIENKPEWFSENNYSFFLNNNNNFKPYKIDKGIISLIFEKDFHLFISKQLSSDSLLQNFSIPFNFFLNFPLDLSMYIILSNFPINHNNSLSLINILQQNHKENNSSLNQINQINQINQNVFFIKLTFNQFNIELSVNIPSYFNKTYYGKIKNKKKYLLSLNFYDLFNNNNNNDNSINLNKLSLLFESNHKKILEDNLSLDSFDKNNNNNLIFDKIFLTFLFINKNSNNNKNSSFSFFLD